MIILAILNDSVAFNIGCFKTNQQHTSLSARQKKGQKSKRLSGGGFGSKLPTGTSHVTPVSADKNALESQWDSFASITNLEIVPPGNPEDDSYQHFIVADVFVRVGPDNDKEDDKPGTGWYRTGKVVAAGETDINAALTLQKGIILWTGVHMWPQLAAKGKAAAKQLQLGFMPPSMNMADETDSALDEEDVDEIQISHRAPVEGVSIKDIGFRPDFNPPGFTYKRRESAAMKKRKSAMEEIKDAS
ncbi:hypothetical protein ACHAWF_007678 [Thalassiosira exigua]